MTAGQLRAMCTHVVTLHKSAPSKSRHASLITADHIASNLVGQESWRASLEKHH